MYCHPIHPINSSCLALTPLDPFFSDGSALASLLCVCSNIYGVCSELQQLYCIQNTRFHVISLNLKTLMNVLSPFPQYPLDLGEEETDISFRAMLSAILA